MYLSLSIYLYLYTPPLPLPLTYVNRTDRKEEVDRVEGKTHQMRRAPLLEREAGKRGRERGGGGAGVGEREGGVEPA